jgi:hypothetical protein
MGRTRSLARIRHATVARPPPRRLKGAVESAPLGALSPKPCSLSSLASRTMIVRGHDRTNLKFSEQDDDRAGSRPSDSRSSLLVTVILVT